MNTKKLLSAVKFDEKGLVCAIAQDWQSSRVLMVAWMNAEAIAKTAETGFAHYYSRSRQKQWMKGEESGHTQKVRELRLDCDGDAIVMLVEQHGGIACHTGRESCFYQKWDGGQWQTADAVLKDENEIYGHNQQ
ncbi:phosphoribosyl-AMP cyclohydrolase [Neisseria iguanae]|uniref:Phosphoribosyl-AMP cyclohydrolase n=1 Tax=Neisseria iguanae TaxID=90242 RepID=A0A2P7U1R1_9NEIS|nr:phosphoribosyl-AMP cyclohydrolase [Neisseria iguanae]PSJ80924.1 phosphoribosyl-AMP cyclohydrolase [Neisseria iguanae]